MGLRWYICHYPPRPDHAKQRSPHVGDDLVGSYSSFIWANSFAHARVLARRRNIGEVVDGTWGSRHSKPYPLTSDLLSKRRLSPTLKIDIIHSATFLSYLLMRCMSAPSEDILGDEGLLHQVIHCLAFGSPRRSDTVGVLRYFEGKVPGYVARG